ncbi:MFS family permease [Streptacidiphilus sp. MAP12-16]|uniref:MFS transporter n=1 Tax=Streptacidiphilus sp. MAP12-16 TaxID=3156300 RepID=UPI0035155570
MLSVYRRIFAPPGSLGFSAAGFIARMPISMTSVGIVTMLSQLRGQYRLAGAVAATLALATATLGPQISRLVDRHGQRRVILPATAVTVAAMGALLLCARYNAPNWTLFVTAAVAGCMPSMGSLVRARWAEIYRGSPQLHIAYSLESVLDEVIYIVGPILSIGLCTVAFPEAGPLLSACLLALGVVLFAAQRRTEPSLKPEAQRTGGSALKSRGLGAVALTFVAVGAIFGSVDVVTVAFAGEHHHKAFASVLLAVYALGSCVAGIVFGTVRPRGPLSRQFLIGVSTMAASLVPLLFAPNLAVLTGMLLVAGMSIAPTIITAMGLVERLVPAARLTEGMTWTATGLAVGVALGSSAAGWVVDAAGAADGYAVTVAAGLLATVVASLALPRLRVDAGQRTPRSCGKIARRRAGRRQADSGGSSGEVRRRSR